MSWAERDLNALIAYMIIEEATHTAVFHPYVGEMLVPALCPT